MLRRSELLTMWSSTRMVVLAALVAALYVCLLLPFKMLVIVPGYTEIRPGVVVPLVCSFLFGPAAAWGAAFGNLVGDVFGGMLGPGSIFGMIGNFLLGFVPYKLWANLFRGKPSGVLGYLARSFVGVTASAACAVTVGWGVQALGILPFAALGIPIALNDSGAAVLAPFLVLMLLPRIRRMGLLYPQILSSRNPKGGLLSRVVGPSLVIGGAFGGLGFGVILAAAGSGKIGLLLAPFWAAIIVGCAML